MANPRALRLSRLLKCLLLLALATPLRAAWVSESTNEFFASADFDSDGRPDLVIVDKLTGDYRLGYQLSAGAFTWPSPRASGIENVTSFSVARFFNTNREALAFTAPAANRVNLFDASSSASNGLPVSVFPGSSFTLAQDFESETAVKYTLSQLAEDPAPAVQPAGAGSTGSYLRLIHDNAGLNRNVVTFDRAELGLFQNIVAEFDFRLTSVGTAGDGFAFMLIPTANFGPAGAGFVTPIAFEEPNIAGVFAVAVDVYDPSFADVDTVALHWNGVQVHQTVVDSAKILLTTGTFHRARVSVEFTNVNAQAGALVSVTFIPNINSLPGTPYTPINRVFVPGLLPYENRAEFGASGPSLSRNMSVDLDNLKLQYLEPLSGMNAVGPNLIVGLPFGGPAKRELDDLVVGSQWNSPPNLSRLDLLRLLEFTNASSFGSFATSSASPTARGNAVTLKTGIGAYAGHIVRESGTDVFRAMDVSRGAGFSFVDASGLPPGADYVAAPFSGTAYWQFLFWSPGQSNLLQRSVQELTPGVLSFAPVISRPVPGDIQQVFTLPGTNNTKLLIIFEGATNAAVFNFNGASTPTLLRSFTAQAGETFTGAGALAGNSFVMLSGRDGSRTSTFFQTWNFDGVNYSAGASGNLPSITPLTAPANVFFFRGEPFVTNSPILLRTVNARDWSIALSGLPDSATAQAEAFAGMSNGLRYPLPVVLGVPPTSATDALVNQYREPISLFGHGPANGDTVADLNFTPAPGVSANGVSVTISANNPNCQVFHRVGTSGQWNPYTAPVRLFRTTTLYACARALTTGQQSRIKTATYTITTPPDKLDTDGDGVPDYVEIAKGTDPTRPDTDGDGYTDWDELLKGTDPNSTNSFATNVTQKLTTFDLRVTPFPLNGLNSTVASAAPGTPVRLADLQGNIQAAGEVETTFASLTNVPADQTRRLLTFSTELNFKLPGVTDADLGRELIGVMTVPAFSPVVIPNTYTGADNATDANNWIAAATNAYASATNHPQLTNDLTIPGTLAAAVLEKAISQILLARGYAPATNLSLFSARAPDVARDAPSHSTLLSLESYSNGLPTYSLQKIYLTISNQVFNPTNPDILSLRRLATNIYRISSASNYFIATNVLPAGTTGTNLVYPLPLDVLRQFLDAGTIHSNYYAGRSLSPEEFSAADQTNARRALTNILASITPRPTTNLTLQVRADTFTAPCILLDATNGATTWTLLDARGAPYRLIESFNLVPGSRVQALGFTDPPTNPCTPAGLEVISVDLVSVPGVIGDDLNGNGLPDSWETLFQITDPDGDADGDGASNRAEFLAGTDPRDPNSHPLVVTTPLPSLIVHLEKLANGNVRLSWDLAAEWANRLDFHVFATPDLQLPFTDTGLVPSWQAGRVEVVVPTAGAPAQFYAVIMTVR